MAVRTVQEWVRWIYDNNPTYATSKGLTLSRIARLGIADSIEFCRDYLKAVVKLDGKKGILYQEKQMAHQLGIGL